MLTIVPPIAVNHLLSARVEKRGPSTTTMTPPSVAAMPCRRRGFEAVRRPTGQYGSAKFTCTAPSS